MLLPRLDSPAPTPEASGYTAPRTFPPLIAQESLLALPAPTLPGAEIRRRSVHPLSE